MKQVFSLFLCLLPGIVAPAQSRFMIETNMGSFLPLDPTRFGDYHALIVAVQRYDGTGWADPGPTIEYGRTLKQILTEKYTFPASNIRFLQDPTRQEIIAEFESLRGELGENDNLLIFYAGLGTWLEEVSQGYWIPRDGDYENSKTWVPNSVVKDYVSRINTRNTLLIADARLGGVDSMRSGGGAISDSAMAVMSRQKSRRAIIGNSMRDLLVNKDFVQMLIQVLDKNQKRLVTAQQVFSDIVGVVRDISGQAPAYGPIQGAYDEGGDFIFVRK